MEGDATSEARTDVEEGLIKSELVKGGGGEGEGRTWGEEEEGMGCIG